MRNRARGTQNCVVEVASGVPLFDTDTHDAKGMENRVPGYLVLACVTEVMVQSVRAIAKGCVRCTSALGNARLSLSRFVAMQMEVVSAILQYILCTYTLRHVNKHFEY